RESELARPDARPESGVDEAELLVQLPPKRFVSVLARLDAAARRDPERRAARPRPAKQQRPSAGVDDESAHGATIDCGLVHPLAQRAEPAQSLRVANRGVRGGRRREDVET